MRTAQESVHLVAATIGFASYAGLWAGTLWGTVLRSGWATSRVRHQTVHGIHMHLILLGLTLGTVHAIVQMAAPYGKVRAIDVVVPFTDRADPTGLGLGVLALELMIATALSVLIQRKLGYARWRALHSLGYLSFTLVAAHILISGTEMYPARARMAIVASWAVVVLAGISTVARVARLPRALLDRLSPRHRAEEVRVSVDPGKCGSFGFCEQEAPGIFTLRSDQRLAYRSVVSSEQAEEAMRAAVVCPARAIKLGRLPATVVVSQPGADTSTVAPLATALTPHSGSRPAAADPHAGSLAPTAAAVDAGTGAHPRSPTTDTGSFARAAHGQAAPPTDTGSFPRVATGPDTGSFPPIATGPGVAGPDTGSFPRIAGGPAVPRADTGAFPPIATGPSVAGPGVASVDTGSFPRIATAAGVAGLGVAGPGGGPYPRVGADPLPPLATGSPGPGSANGHTGPQPALRPVAGPPGRGRPPGLRSVGRPAPVDPPADEPLPGPDQTVGRRTLADPPPEDPLPAPDQLQDTGRHHLPRLRGIAGGRS